MIGVPERICRISFANSNPFKLGMIGGTDSHNGAPGAVAEDTFQGQHGPEDGSVEARRDGGVGGWIDGKICLLAHWRQFGLQKIPAPQSGMP